MTRPLPRDFWRLSFADFILRSAYQLGKTPVLPLYAAALGAGEAMIGFVVASSTFTGIVAKPVFGFLSRSLGTSVLAVRRALPLRTGTSGLSLCGKTGGIAGSASGAWAGDRDSRPRHPGLRGRHVGAGPGGPARHVRHRPRGGLSGRARRRRAVDRLCGPCPTVSAHRCAGSRGRGSAAAALPHPRPADRGGPPAAAWIPRSGGGGSPARRAGRTRPVAGRRS